MTKPIFVIHGLPYTRASGGIRALYKLEEMLRRRGEYVTMVKSSMNGVPELDDGPVVLIEPEIFGGNCQDAALTVRWLLNYPGRAGMDLSSSWSHGDLLYHFDERFKFKDSQPLCVPHIDETIFNNIDNPEDANRTFDCVYSHKAIIVGEQPQMLSYAIDVSPRAGIVKAGDWETLRYLFRKTGTFFSWEETATAVEAALCGAKVKFIPSIYMPTPPTGDTVEVYRNLVDRSEKEVSNFVDACYKRLGLGACV